MSRFDHLANPDLDDHLGEAFWSARPSLDHVRQAARARRVAPAAVLGVVLARVAAFTPPSTCVPPFVGSHVPLSVYVALMSSTGGGKSAPAGVGRDLIPNTPPGVRGPLPLGSGEGVSDAYLELVEQTDDDGKKVKRKKQTQHGALFDLDEGRTLAEMAGRRGATIAGVLCTAWTGGELGQANASTETFRHLPANSYALGLVSAWQPARAAGLFDESDGGLPGRFLYLPTDDPDAPDTAPAWPGRLDFDPAPVYGLPEIVCGRPLDFDPAIVAEVDAERLTRLRGETVPEALDAHRTLGRLKVAGLLAVLDHRTNVDPTDWQLAGQLLRLSNLTRSGVVEHIAAERARGEQARIDHHVRKTVAEATTTERRALHAAARAVGRRANREAGEVLARKHLTIAVKGADRRLVDLDDVLVYAIGEGWLEQAEGGYRAGRSQPS